jgi:hypothetical protein
MLSALMPPDQRKVIPMLKTVAEPTVFPLYATLSLSISLSLSLSHPNSPLLVQQAGRRRSQSLKGKKVEKRRRRGRCCCRQVTSFCTQYGSIACMCTEKENTATRQLMGRRFYMSFLTVQHNAMQHQNKQ